MSQQNLSLKRFSRLKLRYNDQRFEQGVGAEKGAGAQEQFIFAGAGALFQIHVDLELEPE